MKKNNSTKLDVYVNFKGCCREAFEFYEKHLCGKIISMLTFKEQPGLPKVSKEQENDILHARMELGGAVPMEADIQHAEPVCCAYL